MSAFPCNSPSVTWRDSPAGPADYLRMRSLSARAGLEGVVRTGVLHGREKPTRRRRPPPPYARRSRSCGTPMDGCERSRSQLEQPPYQPHAVLQRLAVALAETYLRPALARAVIPFIVHEPQDLNVSRVACARGVSRWTLQRRARASTGLCAKQLVALAQLVTAMACLRQRAATGDDPAFRTGRPLSRRERRVVRSLLGTPPAALRRVLETDGTRGVERLLIERLGQSVVRATFTSSASSLFVRSAGRADGAPASPW